MALYEAAMSLAGDNKVENKNQSLRVITYRNILIGALLLVFARAGLAEDRPPLDVVDAVDLKRYLGKWFEVASYPAWFQ
jgi:hypothetical protein